MVADGTNRLQANLCYVEDLEVAADGTLYVSQATPVLHIGADGKVTRVAGGGDDWADDGKATEAALCGAAGIALSAQGGFYVVDREAGLVRYVGTDGQISTVAGKNPEFCPVGTFAAKRRRPRTSRRRRRTSWPRPMWPRVPTAACTSRSTRSTACTACAPTASSRASPAPPSTASRRRRTRTASRRPTPQLSARRDDPRRARRRDVPNEQVNCCDTRVRRIGQDGIITTVAGPAAGRRGRRQRGPGPVATANPVESFGFALAPDGSIAIASQDNYILRVASPLPGGLAERNVNIPSGDGSEVWQFTPAGRHLKTYDALTGTVKFTFGYDDAGLLVTVTDRHGNVTTIERGTGGKPLAIVAPGGQRTDADARRQRLPELDRRPGAPGDAGDLQRRRPDEELHRAGRSDDFDAL